MKSQKNINQILPSSLDTRDGEGAIRSKVESDNEQGQAQRSARNMQLRQAHMAQRQALKQLMAGVAKKENRPARSGLQAGWIAMQKQLFTSSA
ncbi:hypothetical protein [Craterilacuibacter sp. RT1T]|uniref:hypothetical protein n=1 Tax=Craterilacuibacter sp. RT1T TaxID=2942211 RepID=UPI0020C04527|nr:hypothetical protein [Craterilacuibacter sp. RT1T]MCL6262730.1 hypothetical protein [Craterilacuibacter sp. RT1T]